MGSFSAFCRDPFRRVPGLFSGEGLFFPEGVDKTAVFRYDIFLKKMEG